MNKTDIHQAVFIIDGSSFLYRAYYSIRPLHSPDGTPVQAVYGFCRMIKKLIATYEPRFMVLAWDSRGKTMRHEIYENYKGGRQAAPSDLSVQKDLIQQFAEHIGLTQIQTAGVEADDLMYSLAHELAQEQVNSVIVTSDKDMGQTLSEHIIMLDPFKDAFIYKKDLEERFGFPIERLPFYYALVGDAADNIPGVRGIGPKGAQELVKRFNSLDDLYDKLETISSIRTRELLQVSKENAFLSLELFTLRLYPLQMTASKCAFDSSNWDNARPLFVDLGFKSLLKEKSEDKSAKSEVVTDKAYTFKTITDEEEFYAILDAIRDRKYCAIDTQGTSLKPLEGEMVGLSLCYEESHSYYIPFGHKTEEKQLSREFVLTGIKAIFEDATIAKYLHHAKFAALMLYHEAIILRGITFDTMIASSLLITDGQRLGLKYSDYYVQEPMLTFTEQVKKKNYKDFSYMPLGEATQLAAADAHQTFRLYNRFSIGLQEENIESLFYDIEMSFMHVLYQMELTGIVLDKETLSAINEKVTKELAQLRQIILDLIGPEYANINLNSPKQLEELLFINLKLPVLKKTTQRTRYSTDQEVLRELAKLHPVPALIMRYRELYKIKSTYLDSLGDHINPETGRIHTTFNQTGVATGRLSSSEPNLQNIPVDKFHIRSAFKSPDGHVFLSADYSQIELRVLAYMSQDQMLVSAFERNQDIHALTAAGLFDISVEQVTSEQRHLGKRINFSILYGLTPHGLSKDLDISYKTAKNYIDKFMSQYPEVSSWMEKVVYETKEKGYVTTHWGRRRYLPGIYEKNKTLYELARRMAINTKAQGTAAEIMKIGMIGLQKALEDHNLKAKLILQIHDELILEVPSNELLQTERLVTEILQKVVECNVPLVVTTRSGQNWQEVTK